MLVWHERGKWMCARCETLIQARVVLHIIDKGIPTVGLPAQVLVAKYLDHLSLYWQDAIFSRAGRAIMRSTLAAWVGPCGVHLQLLVDALGSEMLQRRVLHADETPVVEARNCWLSIGRQWRLAARFLLAFDYAIFSDGARRQMAMKSGLPLTARE